MWSIAVKTLVSDRGKLLTALVGVVFAIVLVNVQGGLFLGLITKASLLVGHSSADIWVGHRDMRNVDFPQDIPKRWIHRVRGTEGVASAEPYLVGWGTMTLPGGGYESVVVAGCDRTSLTGNAWNVSGGSGDCVRKPDGIIVDEFEAEKLEYPSIGDLREIGGHRARIVGTSRGIVGFLVAPYVFTTIDRANRFLNKPPDTCSYYLVEVAPGADAAEVCARVRRRVPELDAHLAGDYGRMSIDFWMKRTGLGISFGAATFLGLLVGLIMVGQTLYASVLDRLEEFATLKAIGADERQIYGILFTQAVILAGAGSVLGLLIVTAIQHGFDSPKAPVLIPWWLSLGSCITVLAICLVSSVLPYLRIRKVDPATVLQS